ncbi:MULTISPECIES: BlaI/MecI/CopY family transcriptional regulator [Persicobacter]|uniref:Transcriptional regulator n=1 Tax=Persicobacter diffluens TaxID=981 RepID=A0AAN5AJY1_9BACT|nr:BlaI/MecI/CopY family transcriptional regulator [Persicobacter sp. CCB-QB2]GJM59921.1 transcriptional regulator [Persicobacter diffluens]
MKDLTKAEEQIMQVLWKKEKAFIKDIIEELPEPKPAYNTVSTIVRILQKKEIVGHEAYGRSHRYFPLMTKDEYRKYSLTNLLNGYFGGSLKGLVSFFAKEKDLNLAEYEALLKELDPEKDQDQ